MLPQATSADLEDLTNLIGAMLYDTDTNQMVVNIDGTFEAVASWLTVTIP